MKKYIFILLTIFCIAAISCKKNRSSEGASDNAKSNSNFVTLKSGIIVEKRGNDYFLDGDIQLTPAQLKYLDEKGSFETEGGKKITGPEMSLNPITNLPINLADGTVPRNLGINGDPYRLWAMVRFTYGSSVTNNPKSAIIRAHIKQALLEIQSKSNVRFYNATGQPTVDPTYGFAYPYIEINYVGTSSDVSESSIIGRNPAGGKQTINLADFAVFYSFDPRETYERSDYATIIHELCHAVGMMHEQKRPDRDNYVNINTSNLKNPAGTSQFQPITSNYSYFGSYDFNSVMGYSSLTSSSSIVYDVNQPMYTKKDGTNINQGTTLSDLDRLWLNQYHIPYIARSDVYRELDATVYKTDNTIATPQERLQFQASLNNGNPNPPPGGQIPNNF
ncbi:M12 family metallopeptidase [Pedobacter cryoconitis]|uniref:M12 family metallopeptidase n=1 Tax=Pedobacter cryoconitis TaxID=188932 RepID=UPI00161F9A05|nr:M12 family metallopeptidase [Pedobacter cryoconitis]MBB5643993.1 hypothetical protein [Pedobacter cryoconitis]